MQQLLTPNFISPRFQALKQVPLNNIATYRCELNSLETPAENPHCAACTAPPTTCTGIPSHTAPVTPSTLLGCRALARSASRRAIVGLCGFPGLQRAPECSPYPAAKYRREPSMGQYGTNHEVPLAPVLKDCIPTGAQPQLCSWRKEGLISGH